MKFDRADQKVFGLAVLIAAVFVTTAAGWGVPLIGDSRRWAAVVIILLGLAAGALSAPGRDSRSYVLAGLVLVAFLCAVVSLATGSLVPLALLVACILALIADSTTRHVRHRRGTSLTA